HLCSVDPGQRQVEHQHVDLEPALDGGEDLAPVGGLAHHLHVVALVEELAQAAADDGVVVGDEDPDHAASSWFAGESGMVTCTSVPPCAGRPKTSRPPTESARS